MQTLTVEERAPGVVALTLRRPEALNALNDLMFAELTAAAGESARFQAVFVRLGLSGGDLGASWLLPRLVGPGMAAEVLYSGRPIDAEEAVRIGLANRSVPDDQLLDRATVLAAAIARNEPLGVALTKRSLRANLDSPSFASALELESRAQVGLLREPATQEAVANIRRRWSDRRGR